MAELYQDIPSLGAKERAILRRQKIAEQLQAQSQQPLETNQMAGGYVIPTSPLSGVAKLIQAFAGAKQSGNLDDEYGKLADERSKMVADELAKYNQVSQGTPAVEMQGQTGIPSQNAQDAVAPTPYAPAQPAVEGNPRAAVTQAMLSQLPELQRIGALEMTNLNRKEDRADTQAFQSEQAQLQREQRKQELELRLQDARLSREERDKLQRDLAEMNNQSREDMVRLAASLRPPPAAVAPTMTEVVDPKDPSKLLRVDARTYRGGSIGDEGVLGISGKEPSAAKKEEQAAQGQSALSDSITTLRTMYKDLDANNAIANPDKSWRENIQAGIGSSPVGQAAGKMVGTQNQSTRNSINMQRPLLLQAIKQATGMSSKQMDSNAELNLWLRSATDPTLDIKANLQALDSIERKYLNGGSAASPSSAPPGQSAIDAEIARRRLNKSPIVAPTMPQTIPSNTNNNSVGHPPVIAEKPIANPEMEKMRQRLKDDATTYGGEAQRDAVYHRNWLVNQYGDKWREHIHDDNYQWPKDLPAGLLGR